MCRLREGGNQTPAPDVTYSVIGVSPTHGMSPASRLPFGRILVVMLLLCLTVWAQTSALTSEHDHHDSGHCCLLCHAGPLAYLSPGVTSAVTPVFRLTWLAAPPDFGPAYEVLVASGSCRAPPLA